MKKVKSSKTEFQLVEELLKNEGFTRITEREKRSPDFRDSLKEFSLRKKKMEAKQVISIK